VVLTFAGNSQTRFAEYTHTHLGQHLTVTRDGTVVESAVIADIVPGATEITGLPTLQDARIFAAYLKDGPLPLSLRPIDTSVLQN
jgi:preprotein translocase subunit SecD